MITLLRTLRVIACAVSFVTQLSAAESPRERLSLDANWKFHPGDVIRGLRLVTAGASGICFVGHPQAARSPLFNYYQVQKLNKNRPHAGPHDSNYPADCLVYNCLIHLTGRVEWQSADQAQLFP